MKTYNLTSLRQLKAQGEKFVTVTAYDASFARAAQQAEIEAILVGDSLGMVVQGHDSTLPVTVEEMVYHTRAVARGNQKSLLIADMPFMSYGTVTDALHNAGALMRAGAQVVKLEGGAWLADTITALNQQGVPVCAHLGLTPQFVNKLGGYRVQGREQHAAEQMLADAHRLEHAGADLLVLECVPSALAASISRELSIPVIGIGAGADTDAQVLVMYDLLGLIPKPPKFSRNFLTETGDVVAALKAFGQAVKAGEFPGEEHSFK